MVELVLKDIGYQMSLEQFQPDVALEHAILAEQAGFNSIWASDHFLPWFDTNAASAFAWAWLGAAGQATRNIKLGTGLTCPIFRYHPAIVAQAFATLNYMYKDRIFLSVGTGEPLNEMPLGYEWPTFSERLRRLEESVTIIRSLWSGKPVTHKSNYYPLRRARLYTPPRSEIPIYVAANGPSVTELAGRIGDGLLTTPATDERYKTVIFPALEKGLDASQRHFEDIEKSVEVWMSYDEDYDEALKSVRPWAGSLLPVCYKYGVSDPKEIESLGDFVGNEQLAQAWIIGTSSEPFVKHIQRYAKLGFTQIHVTSSSPDQKRFIELFGKEVLPYLRQKLKE